MNKGSTLNPKLGRDVPKIAQIIFSWHLGRLLRGNP